MFFKIINHIIATCNNAENALFREEDFSEHNTLRYMSDDFYDYELLYDGFDLKFRIYEDANIDITLSDGLEDDIQCRITNTEIENNFEETMIILEVLIKHYFWGVWHIVVSHVRTTGVSAFVEEYKNKNIEILGSDIYISE